MKIISKKYIPYTGVVYDLKVETDPSYNVEGVIVHNSGAGSIISYLLGITKIDPIKLGLLFERFLSEARIGTSMPDIDNDIASDRRDEVKRYIEQRYGVDCVTSIASNGTFKIRSVVKDVGKYYGADFSKTNYITGILPKGEEADNIDITEVFKLAVKSPQLKSFIQSYPQVIEDFQLIGNGNAWRTFSMHAGGIVIVPKEYNGEKRNIYDWLPVKKVDGVLLSEWEMDDLDVSGYLKADILGVQQLQKFAEMIKLIEKNQGLKIGFDDMELKDNAVYKLFQKGWNQDVFQFGAVGLMGYCKTLKPTDIADLIATVALYRPGPMGSGLHTKYADIKNSGRIPEYDYMLEEITKETYGVLCYQEQIMQAVHVLGGLTLVEAEDVRKALGKKIAEKMKSYGERFIKGAQKNGCSEDTAIEIWNKIEQFAAYSFNKSHATAYAYTGYFAQWLKCNFPIEFWSISLHHSAAEEVSGRIGEIHRVSKIKVLPPDINHSCETFVSDFDKQLIYWSLMSIKQVGTVTLTALMDERNKNGQFFSFAEFCDRIQKRVDKRGKLNLILAGCFDALEHCKVPSDRLSVIHQLYNNVLEEQLPQEFTNTSNISLDRFWTLKQREITGFGKFDYEKIYRSIPTVFAKKTRYLDSTQMKDESINNTMVEVKIGKSTSIQTKEMYCVGGVVIEVEDKSFVRDGEKKYFGKVTLDHNGDKIHCIIWTEIWPDLKSEVMASENKIMFISGVIVEDKVYEQENVLQTSSFSAKIIDNSKIKIL